MTAALLGGCGSSGPSFAITRMGLAGEETGPTGAAHMDGGDSVRILGVGFEDGAEIFFGTQASPTVTYVSGSELLAVTPAMPEGYVDLTVRNPDGEETTSSGVFYFGVPPQAVSIEAISGPTLGKPSVRADTTAQVELKGSLLKD
ncbi:MAG: IPT/TIG domain-containing protein, partial [Planctomycetota bacterium]